MVLDGIAAYKFLFEGKGSHFIAVAKAHFSFYAHLSSTLKKRKAMKALPNFNYTHSGICKDNIVYLHFVKGVKTFKELVKEN